MVAVPLESVGFGCGAAARSNRAHVPARPGRAGTCAGEPQSMYLFSRAEHTVSVMALVTM